MNHARDEAVLITGGSRGIGFELAKLFAKDGRPLVLVARDSASLERAASELRSNFGAPVKILPRDLSSAGAPREIYEILQEEGVTVKVLVNNAGTGTYGKFSETDLIRELEMMQLNMVSLTHLTKLFLRGMLRQGQGKILNVASTAAFVPGPWMAVYYATKAYVLSFSEALAEELRGTGVTVTCVCPGPTETDFQGAAEIGEISLFKKSMMGAGEVARAAYEGLERKKRIVIPGRKNKLVPIGARLSPRTLLARAVRYLQTNRR